MTKETEREIAERLVREDETRVARQRAIVAVLRRSGLTGGRPEKLLAAFEASLAENREHLARLRGGQKECRLTPQSHREP